MTDGWAQAVNQGGAIGIVALLIVGCVVIGKYVALPALKMKLQIQTEETKTTENIRATCELQERIAERQEAISRNMTQGLEVLERVLKRTGRE